MYRHKNKSYSAEHENYLKQVRRGNILTALCQAALLVLFIAVWEIAAQTRLIDPFIFSRPSRIFSAFLEMCSNGSLFLHIGVTAGETLLGFAISTAAGILIAVLLWRSGFLRRVISPYLVVINSLPKTALAPIIIVWVGNNVKSVIATAVMTSIIVTILTVLGGFLEVDNDKLKLIDTFRGTKSQQLFKVVLPSSLPTIINAVKINIGLCFVGVAVGEFLVAKAGLGYLIVYGSQIFKMDWVLLSIIILCLLAALMYQGIVIFEKRIKNRFQ